MKRVLIAAAAVTVAGVCSAQAADLAARPYYAKAPAMVAAVYDWSGLYIGLNGGGGSSRSCLTLNSYFYDNTLSKAEGCHDATGGTFGGQIGYRWQAANWVFGLEGQGNWADFSGSSVSQFLNTDGPGSPGAPDHFNRSRIESFGLITGQVGYAFNNALVYVKGGVAVVDSKFDDVSAVHNKLIGDGTLYSSVSDTRWGGTVGAGLEVGLAPNWSIGAEYNHIFLGDRNVSFAANGGPYKADNVRQDIDMGLVRLNYKFNGLR